MDTVDFDYLILSIAKENNTQLKSFKKSIEMYFEDGWEKGACSNWKTHTNWDQDSLPDINIAIKLLCKAYANFVTKYENNESSLEEIIYSKLCLFLDDDMTDACASYLTYRVQRDFYEISQERGKFVDLPWEKFVFAMCHYKLARDAAVAVLMEAIKQFQTTCYSDFCASGNPLHYDNNLVNAEINGDMTCAELMDTDKKREIVQAILLKVEIIQYQRQLYCGRRYLWKQYLLDVMKNRTLWNEIIEVFHDAIWRLDFKPIWLSNDLDKLVSRLENSHKDIDEFS